ncbi:MAG: GTPase domain-containing protein [Actinobacteria bacterium]|nr:GTPase domain-containing protein [Actinomycetota bacterium]
MTAKLAVMTLVAALRDLAGQLAARAGKAPSEERADGARRLRAHIDELLLPRAVDLDSPLVVVLLGSTGSGKSSLINAIAAQRISPSGVLRPTTRVATALVHPDDSARDLLPGLRAEGKVELRVSERGQDGLVVIDSPDFDSVEADNRAMARRLLESADLIVFVTTATRYADEVPWNVLGRARERGVPMLTVINRLPLDREDREAVVADYRRLLAQGGLEAAGVFGSLKVVEVVEGAVDETFDGLDREAVAALLGAFDRLRENAEERRDLARRSLHAALSGLPEAVGPLADEMEEEAAEAEALLEHARDRYQAQQAKVLRHIERGTFLRSEVLKQWQEFVGTNQVVKLVSEGIGKVAATIRSLFDPGPPAPATEVRAAAFEDLVALVVSHADTAAAATAAHWSQRPYGEQAMAGDPSLWGAMPGLGEQVEADLERWAASISREVRTLGEQRRGWAKAASIGVNAVGTSAILAVFASTGGLTGAEAGIAAVTAMVNQALLEALFGEANVADMIDRARNRLDGLIGDILARDRSRFEKVLGAAPESADRADAIRALARQAAESGS